MMPLYNMGVLNAGGDERRLYEIIQQQGLGANLKLCLDAGDSASYAGGSLTTTAGPSTLTSNPAGWNSFTLRQVIAAAQISTSGSQVIVTFGGDGSGTFTCSKAYIGHNSAGDAYDFDSAPVQLTFGGSASFTVTDAGEVSSDPATFTLDETKNLVISFYVASNAVDDFGCQVTLTGWSSYWKAGDDAATQNATGYTNYTATRNVVGVKQVDVVVTGNGGQTWADRSSSATNFYRGVSGVVDVGDPAFNGSVGDLSSGTYWLLDSDRFTGASGIPAWMQPFHKDGATYTMMWGLYHPSGGAGELLSGSPVTSRVKVTLNNGDPRKVEIDVNNSTVQIFNYISTLTLTNDAWNIFGVSVIENGGASGGAVFINGSSETFNPGYTGPDATDRSGEVYLANMTDSHRLAWCAIWDAALSVAQMQAVYAQTRRRFGL